MGRCSGRWAALTISQQALLAEAAYVWAGGHEAQGVEACHELRMHAAAGVGGAMTISLLSSTL